MLVITEFSRTAQRVACAVMAVVIVFTVLLLGALAATLLTNPGYLVTITQIE